MISNDNKATLVDKHNLVKQLLAVTPILFVNNNTITHHILSVNRAKGSHHYCKNIWINLTSCTMFNSYVKSCWQYQSIVIMWSLRMSTKTSNFKMHLSSQNPSYCLHMAELSVNISKLYKIYTITGHTVLKWYNHWPYDIKNILVIYVFL